MESFVKVLLAVLICSQGLCSQGPEEEPAEDVMERSNLQFSIDLYKESVKKEENVFFSPWSLQTTLGMVYAGAEKTTKSQMQKALSFLNNSNDLIYKGLYQNLISIQNTTNRDISLDAGNRVYVSNDTTLNPKYHDILQNTFQSGASGVNFQNENIYKYINAWVQQKTRGKILELIPNGALGPETKMVLVNAIYFKGHMDD
ncbi:unnamed protein product [Darwinula stevensoni]|uniref:Serpin domain-containing protein n=1 Tax=Darwinula stevensoni TaxID=69355 RepID=A0A7R9A469_9CRUS|nr:unnamed protein product [Darwinula stevensoni]CAG0889367.1 unnamed protein product [Darwinula stevensoni]